MDRDHNGILKQDYEFLNWRQFEFKKTKINFHVCALLHAHSQAQDIKQQNTHVHTEGERASSSPNLCVHINTHTQTKTSTFSA